MVKMILFARTDAGGPKTDADSPERRSIRKVRSPMQFVELLLARNRGAPSRPKKSFGGWRPGF
jgi:hypothetical protein